jgi:putative ABC transport system permease protein
MSLLAQRNLLHDKIRLAVTLTGVVFAVMLIVIEMALVFGFTRSTSSMIDKSKADLWVSSANVPYVEVGVPFNKSKCYEVKATPGVAEAVRYLLIGTRWSRPDGSQELLQLVGVDLSSSMGRPWNVVEGSGQHTRNFQLRSASSWKRALACYCLLTQLGTYRGRSSGFLVDYLP